MTCIGIDLGTTNSLAAAFIDGKSQLIPNALGESMTPSVVGIDEDGSILVGQAAKERMITHPEKTVANVKRLMGARQKIKLGNQSFSPEEVSSFILKSLKSDTEKYLGKEVTEAVISVPAYFNELQRRATMNAAKLAGLKVELLINEPTAAALAYGLHEKSEENTFLVFDLGGGTFDITIVDFLDGFMEVHASSGDNFLGGENFTDALVQYFCTQSALDEKQLSLKEKSRLKKVIEQLKINLTKNKTVNLSLTLGGKKYQAVVDRNTFLEENTLLVERLKKPIVRALNDAKFTASDLKDVILVGGATRMPFVRDFIVKNLGIFPRHSLNPDEVVALGAAVQAALKKNDQNLSEVVLADICPYTLGTAVAKMNSQNEVIGFRFLPVIQRNAKVPVSRTELIEPVNKKQKEVELEVLQGEHRNPEHNVSLGKLAVKVPKNVEEWPPQIELRYTYDINGLLEVEATVQETGEKTAAVFQNFGTVLSEEEVNKCLQKLKGIKIHPRDQIKNRTLLAKAEALYQELLGEQREYLEHVIHHFELTLESQDEEAVADYSVQLEQILEELEPTL